MTRYYEDYGDHPTPYSTLKSDELYAKYRNSRWDKLSSQERLAVLQETVNRSAAAHGEIGASKVQWMVGERGERGAAANGVIYLNAHYYANPHDSGLQDWNEGSETENISSLMALETVLHEDEHAYQTQVIHDIIECHDPQAEREYKANDYPDHNHGAPIVEREDGILASGLQYIRADSKSSAINYYMYMAQSTERDAFRFSQQKTAAIISRQQALILQEQEALKDRMPWFSHIGEDAKAKQDINSIEEYSEHLVNNGYQAYMEMAQELTHNPHFEQDVNTVLTNSFYGENRPLHRQDMKLTVESEMIKSYQDYSNAMHSNTQVQGVIGTQVTTSYSANISQSAALGSQATFGYTCGLTSGEIQDQSSALSNDSGAGNGGMGDSGDSVYGQSNNMDYGM